MEATKEEARLAADMILAADRVFQDEENSRDYDTAEAGLIRQLRHQVSEALMRIRNERVLAGL